MTAIANFAAQSGLPADQFRNRSAVKKLLDETAFAAVVPEGLDSATLYSPPC